MDGSIRVGQVSSINYSEGTIKVLFQDKDQTVTDDLPILTFNDEYKMPKIGAYVAVALLSNGTEAGYVLGTFWDGQKESVKTGKGVYRKELALEKSKAFFEYDPDKDELVIDVNKIKIKGAKKVRIEAGDIEIEAKSNNITEKAAGKVKVEAAVETTKDIKAADDIVAGSVSLQKHTHPGVHGQTEKPS